MEEEHWSRVYCGAKGIPYQAWSNLNIDVMYKGLGVEHKMLCRRSSKSLLEACGENLMHPSLTRSVRVPLELDADSAMRNVFSQYEELIEQRRTRVARDNPDTVPDMRLGWLLWQESLVEFLYFEVPMVAPEPELYRAEWKQNLAKGNRKASKSLWIYEKETGLKRYSVTTEAGNKIQPYFTVPLPSEPNLFHFVVQGESLSSGDIRIWLTPSTYRELLQILGSLEPDVVGGAIECCSSLPKKDPDETNSDELNALQLLLRESAYRQLVEKFEGVSDEHRIQKLVEVIRRDG